MDSDPTAIDLHSTSTSSDPRVRRITGWTSHKNLYIDVPVISKVAPNLWVGGFDHGLELPEEIKHVVSLFKWGRYDTGPEVLSHHVIEMYDSEDQSTESIDEIATLVNKLRNSGAVLVHCQAGLNRSGTVVARALMLSGEERTGADALAVLREQRSPAMVCNPTFEKWILSFDQ